MPTTPNFALRYPASTDPADVSADMQRLATDVDTALGGAVGVTVPSCRVNRTTAISTNSGQSLLLPFDQEAWDTDNMHNPAVNPSRLTCNTAGRYLIVGGCCFAPSAGGTFRQYRILLNGAPVAIASGAPSAGHGSDATLSTMLNLAVGNYVELFIVQDSGGPLNTALTSLPFLLMQRFSA